MAASTDTGFPTAAADDAALGGWLTALLSDLVAIPSTVPPGDTRAIAAFAAGRLRDCGYAVEVASAQPGIDNVVARLGTGRPSLVFNAHVDTVGIGERAQWRSDPFQAQIRDGHLIGLGAGNCKASMAVQLWLAEAIALAGGPRRGEAVFTFVGDEETLGSNGMAFLRDSGRVRPDMLVLGAQTDCQLITSERGVMWVRVETFGRAAHAGRPSAGDNAISRMVRLINELESRLAAQLAGRRDGAMQSTMNFGTIHGGHHPNVVADRCVVEIDRRLLPEESVEDAFAELERVLKGAGEPKNSWSASLARGTGGFRSATDGALVAAFTAAIAARLGRPAEFLDAVGVSDGRYFADDGIPILNFGPGSASQGHAANESVPVAQLVDAARIQWQAAGHLLGIPV